MKTILTGLAALALAIPAHAQEQAATAPSPNEIVAAAAPDEWVRIAPEDLLVMTLAPDADGNARQVVIQLMPPPFSQGWVHNIRLFARSGWYDGISVNRVQDNYVVQWGDPNYDNPEATGAVKPLPEGLKVMGESDYKTNIIGDDLLKRSRMPDPYAGWTTFIEGWPVGAEIKTVHTRDYEAWPVHCYGMVGVGRNYSPDTGSGAELYTVIGHAPRHLDRNIALVGRVIEGMEHLSSLPRGKGELGFYADFEKDKRTPILSVRVASDIAQFPQPTFEYLNTESESFARYAAARANRRDAFFIVPAGGADICNIPVPVRRVVSE
ncbi:MAG: peptidylprolyl isomerase [Sphingomonadales bacterium BRH_c3]|nr:MAG: peptidylprolyl isomerase [Sphingomonadales bacterium BRH_c3]